MIRTTRSPAGWALAFLILLTAPALAADRTWNRPFNPGTVYSWNTTDPFWNPPSGGATAWNNSNRDTAVFAESVTGTGTGTQRITLPGPINLNGLRFNYVDPFAANVSNWKIEGTGPLNLTPESQTLGSTISIVSLNGVVEIAVPITGNVSASSNGFRRSVGGTLILSAANTYTGRTRIEAGILRLAGGDNRLPTDTVVYMTSAPGPPFVAGILDLNGTNQTVQGIQDGNTAGGLLTLDQIEVKLGGGTLTIDNSSASVATFSGAVTGAGNVVINGTTGWRIAGANTYLGTTTINGGDLTTLGGSNRLPQTTDMVINGGELVLLGSSNSVESVRSLSGSGGRVFTTSNTTLTFGEGDTEPVRTYAGRFEGAGVVIKGGSGTTVLTGTNGIGFGFETNIKAGTLVVNGTYSSTGDFVVASDTFSATVAGSGTIDAPVVVNATGRISPGQQPAPGSAAGMLTFENDLDLSNGGTYQWQLTSLSTENPGTNFDQIVFDPFGSSLTLGGTSKLTLDFTSLPEAQRPDSATLDPFWSQERQWTVLDYQGSSSTQQFGSLTNPNWAAGTFSMELAPGGDVMLVFTPVPEPGMVVAVAAFGLMAFQFRRRSVRSQ